MPSGVFTTTSDSFTSSALAARGRLAATMAPADRAPKRRRLTALRRKCSSMSLSVCSSHIVPSLWKQAMLRLLLACCIHSFPSQKCAGKSKASDIPRMNPGFGQHCSHHVRPRQRRAVFYWICCQGPLNEDFSARRYPCFP